MDQELTQDEQEFQAAFAESVRPPGAVSPQAEPPAPQHEQAEDATDERVQLQSQLAEALHRERSSANRLSHFMRENNQLKAQMQSLQQRVEELGRAKPAPAPAPSDGVRDLLEDAPDLQAAVERRIQREVSALHQKLDAATNRLEQVDQTAKQAAQSLEPLASREEQRQKESVMERLDKSFQGWRGDIRTPDFNRWLDAQSSQVQQMFSEGQSFTEAASVLKLFYADKGATKHQTATNSDRLQRAAGIAPRAVAKPGAQAESFEEAFAEFASKKR